MIDPYLPFIVETLKQYPRLTAARLYQMAQVRGYPGGPSQFRQRIAQLRPRPQPEAYLRLQNLAWRTRDRPTGVILGTCGSVKPGTP
jgi:hypothetical protein